MTPAVVAPRPPLVHLVKAKRKLAVLDTDAIRQIFGSEPSIMVGGYPYRVVPHGQYETALLKRLSYPASNPMREYYNWPCPAHEPPFEVQRHTCDLFTLNERAYCLNDMGTGKTRAALWSWDWLKTAGLSNKLLIAAPLSTLRFTWMKEIFQTIRHRKAVVLHGTRQDRLDGLNDPEADIFIINHDGVKVIFNELMARRDIDTLLIDELAAFRNVNGRSRAMRKLAQVRKFVWGMTGSPMPTEPTDVWSQCTIVTPNTVPKYFSHVRDMLMTRKSQHVFVPKASAIEQAYKFMQPAVRYSLDDVVELPDLIERNIEVDLTYEQKTVYEGIVRHCQALAQNKEITAANAAVAMGKLLQIAGGWVYSGDREVATLDAAPRLKALNDLIIGCSRKVIVFAPFLHAIEGIAKVLDHEKITYHTMHGGTNNRDSVFTAFQYSDKFKVLLAHPRTMAHGITLTAADTIIWFLPITSYEIYEQANARIRRVGQKHKQQVIHLVATPVERRVYSLLRGRQRVQDKFLDLFASNTLALTGK